MASDALNRFVLPDYLEAELDVVFVGTAASSTSAARRHYFSHPGNQFWPLLHAAGFTDRRLTPAEDQLVLRYGIGLTDVVKSSYGSDDSQLDTSEFASDALALEEKLVQFMPRFACFISKNAYRAFDGSGALAFGLQLNVIGASRVFVVPSPSSRVVSTRILDGKTRLEWFRELRSLLLLG